jgi:hypothetical protein
MDGGNERRFAIYFCFKASLSTMETLVVVQSLMGMRLWTDQTFLGGILHQFRDGRELVEDDGRCGPPKSTQTEVNIAAVADLVKVTFRSHQEL